MNTEIHNLLKDLEDCAQEAVSLARAARWTTDSTLHRKLDEIKVQLLLADTFHDAAQQAFDRQSERLGVKR